MCMAQCLARVDPGKARAADPARLMAVTCPTEVLSTLTPSSCPTAPTDLDKQDISAKQVTQIQGHRWGCVAGT